MGPPATAREAKPDVRVGYIAGYGRSGSTLFDIVLGEHPQIFGAGELANLSRRVWTDNEYCSCGAVVRECPFWTEVVDRFLARCGSDALSTYGQLQARRESLGEAAIAAAGFKPVKANGDYARYSLELFSIVASVSGKPVIIDFFEASGARRRAHDDSRP